MLYAFSKAVCKVETLFSKYLSQVAVLEEREQATEILFKTSIVYANVLFWVWGCDESEHSSHVCFHSHKKLLPSQSTATTLQTFMKVSGATTTKITCGKL